MNFDNLGMLGPKEPNDRDAPVIYCDACNKAYYESDGSYRLADMRICSDCQGDFEAGMRAIEEIRE